MAKHTTLNGLFTDIATSLRGKTGNTGKIVADDFPSVIDGIQTGITPTGTKSITTNGSHDVTNYATAKVEVPASGITPSGTKSITSNGEHDVTSYAKASVNVPVPSGYIKPSGTKTITANGTHDVTSFSSAQVNVPTPEQSSVIREITVSSDITNTAWTGTAIMSADAFIKKHYADAKFSATLIPKSQAALSGKTVHFAYHGNANIGASDSAAYGVAYVSTGSTVAYLKMTAKINGEGYNVSLRVDSSGALKVFVSSTYTLKTGDYTVILTCTT